MLATTTTLVNTMIQVWHIFNFGFNDMPSLRKKNDKHISLTLINITTVYNKFYECIILQQYITNSMNV